jgi:hypothetical protein
MPVPNVTEKIADSTCTAAMPYGRTMNPPEAEKICRAELVRRRRIIRASFSQERMTSIAADESTEGVAKVIYESKDGKTSKKFIMLIHYYAPSVWDL